MDLVNPLTYNLANAISNPGKPKRKKFKRKDRQATSSESSAEKPPKSKPRMSAVNGQVSAAVKSINTATAAKNETTDVGGQNTSGRNDPPGRPSGRAGNKGEQFIREFCKMNPVKKECRDNKDERSYRRDNVRPKLISKASRMLSWKTNTKSRIYFLRSGNASSQTPSKRLGLSHVSKTT